MWKYFIFVLYLTSFTVADVCSDYGFNPLLLQCKTCEILKKIIGDEELNQICEGCCIPNPEIDNFCRATLEVDQRFISSFPHLDSIIKLIKTKNQENLKTKYSMGSFPYLKLYRGISDDYPSESLPVSGWSKDDFNEFIKEHVKIC
jgi:hypothetical protein